MRKITRIDKILFVAKLDCLFAPGVELTEQAVREAIEKEELRWIESLWQNFRMGLGCGNPDGPLGETVYWA